MTANIACKGYVALKGWDYLFGTYIGGATHLDASEPAVDGDLFLVEKSMGIQFSCCPLKLQIKKG